MLLVTNVTGFVGRALVYRLAAQRREARCLLRASRHEQKLPTGILFSSVAASFDDQPALRTAMQDVHAVVHVAGEFGLEQAGTLETHVEETANLVEATREVGVSRFVYVSRLGADRTSAYPYFRVLGEAEAKVVESGLDYTILRPAITYGKEDAFTNVLTMLAKMIPLVLPIPGSDLARFQPLWVVDLVRCIEETLDRDDLIGRTVPLGGPEHFSFEQVVLHVLAVARVRRWLWRVPVPLMEWFILTVDTLLPNTPTPGWWLDLLVVGSATDLVTVQRHFDFEPARFTERLEYLGRKRAWRRDLLRLVFRQG